MMNTFKSFNGLLVALLVLALGALWPAASGAMIQATPRSVAERLDAALLDAMRNAKTLGFEGRYENLAPVLETTFDFPFMARVSVGRYWRKMSRAEQAQLVDTFARLSISTFASRFNGFSGETFEITGEEQKPRGAKLVLNRLVKSDGEAVAINFLMREAKGRWRIVDVFLDAKFSELAIKRSEYTAVYKRDGFAGLIEIMEEKIADYAADKES